MEKLKEPFIQAMPLSWICTAANLSGNDVKVALLIWYLSGIHRTKKDLIVSSTQAKKFHISVSGLRRGLLSLEEIGLISTVRGAGKAPRVTILLEGIKEVP